MGELEDTVSYCDDILTTGMSTGQQLQSATKLTACACSWRKSCDPASAG